MNWDLFGDLFLTSIFYAFWSPLGSLWAPFWLPLAPFWLPLAPFWLHFGSLWLPFGTLRAHFLTFGSILASFWHFSLFLLQVCSEMIFYENFRTKCIFVDKPISKKIGDCRTRPQQKGNFQRQPIVPGPGAEPCRRQLRSAPCLWQTGRGGEDFRCALCDVLFTLLLSITEGPLPKVSPGPPAARFQEPGLGFLALIFERATCNVARSRV